VGCRPTLGKKEDPKIPYYRFPKILLGRGDRERGGDWGGCREEHEMDVKRGVKKL
jgi:hypothetical protein